MANRIRNVQLKINLTKEEKELYDAENPRLAMLICSSEEEYRKLEKRIEEMDEDE